MESEREVHAKEFQATMFSSCFNECVSGANALNTPNLTANEGKCLKTCYISFSKRLQQAGQAMGYDCKLSHNFE